MQPADLKQLFLGNPVLALGLLRLRDKLDQVQVLTPEHMPQKYLDFCRKLDRPLPPTLVICPPELMNKVMGQAPSAYYSPISDSVWITPHQLNYLTSPDTPVGTKYIVAHELGHASGPMNRRNVLKRFAGSAAAGVAAGFASKPVFHALLDPDNPDRHPIQQQYGDTVATWAATLVGAQVFDLVHKRGNPGLRAEELGADDRAKSAIGLVGVSEALAGMLLLQARKTENHPLTEAVDQYRATVLSNRPVTTPEEKIDLMLHILDHYDKALPLSALVSKKDYPNLLDRLRHQEGALRDAAASASR